MNPIIVTLTFYFYFYFLTRKVVIFTNQAGIAAKGLDVYKRDAIVGKIEDLSTEVCVHGA
jgi:hypothetical protein